MDLLKQFIHIEEKKIKLALSAVQKMFKKIVTKMPQKCRKLVERGPEK